MFVHINYANVALKEHFILTNSFFPTSDFDYFLENRQHFDLPINLTFDMNFSTSNISHFPVNTNTHYIIET